MLRVKRNCNKIEDYNIVDWFQENGYRISDLKSTKEKIRNMDRESLFKKKTRKKKNHGVAFLTGFTRQHRQFEKIN